MNILYVANIRMPTEKAHGIQIMKACEAFAYSQDIELVVPNRKSHIKEDPFTYYGIKKRFKIKRLFTIDTVGWGVLGYAFQSVMFGIVASIYTKRKKPDVVYGRDEIVLVIISFLTRNKIVWESHDGAWNLWARYLARRAKGMVVVTKGAIDFYKQNGVPEKRILAVSNGIDLNDFANPESKQEARVRLGLPQNEKIALYIGKLDGWKGVETLLEASLLLSDVKVVIIGGEEMQVDELSKKYPNVTFLGYKNYIDLPDNQAAGDVLVVPNTGKSDVSTHFTSPLKLIAHLASNRPVVVSDLPSTRWVADGAALFVIPDDPKALAEGINNALNDQLLVSKLLQNTPKLVKNLSWSVRSRRVLNFLEENL